MATTVQIANLALITYLGKARINSLDEQGPSPMQLSVVFEDARKEILSEWPWSFAVKRQKLALMSTNDRPEWAYRYKMPVGALIINWVGTGEAAKQAMVDRSIEDCAREVEEGFIYADQPDAWIEFVMDQKDTSVYSPKFVQAFAALLASKVAVTLTETASKMEFALGRYAELLDEAKVADQHLNPPIIVIRNRNPEGY